MNILVTGGGGFLGLHICQLLRNDGHDVSSLSRSHYISLDTLDIKTIKCDLRNSDDVSKLDLSSFDAIIHTAAKAGVWGDKAEYFNINYIGTQSLFNQAKECGVKYFIYTSSPSVVFGKEDILNGDESIPYPEKYYTAYAESKALAEEYVLSSSCDDILSLAIRPHLIWGPGDPHLIPRILEKAKLGQLKLVGNGTNKVDIIYVKNAALAHINALNSLVAKNDLGGNAYFIGQEKPVVLWDFINQVLALNKLNPVEKSVSFNLAYNMGYFFELLFSILGIMKPEPPMTRFVALQLAKSHYFSHEKAATDFNYEVITSIDQGLAETFPQKGN